MVTAINKTIILSCFGHLWLIDESVLRQFYITVILEFNVFPKVGTADGHLRTSTEVVTNSDVAEGSAAEPMAAAFNPP